jgi:hypothetical protein
MREKRRSGDAAPPPSAVGRLPLAAARGGRGGVREPFCGGGSGGSFDKNNLSIELFREINLQQKYFMKITFLSRR